MISGVHSVRIPGKFVGHVSLHNPERWTWMSCDLCFYRGSRLCWGYMICRGFTLVEMIGQDRGDWVLLSEVKHFG